VSEDVGAGTGDSSELDDDNDAEDVTVCDSILDAPVNFCCANASTKQLLRLLVCINIVVIPMQNRHDEMNDSEDCDLENIILKKDIYLR